jgi:hypothetical protein
MALAGGIVSLLRIKGPPFRSRAAAGFKVLGQLGTKTQILFFTHHQHLVEIAKATLGKSINIVSLFEPQSAIAA